MKIFVDDNGKVSSAIDRLLTDSGKTRKSDCKYILAQTNSQKPGDYTILEIPFGRSISESSEASDQGGKQPSERVLSASERQQNLKTRSVMKKLQERLKKKGKKAAPTPVAKMDMPCESCGTLTADAECPKCDRVYCSKHVKDHPCVKDQQVCRQQTKEGSLL